MILAIAHDPVALWVALPIGVAVSVAAGVLSWPRGAGRIIGDDLAEAFHLSGAYLAQTTACVFSASATARRTKARP